MADEEGEDRWFRRYLGDKGGLGDGRGLVLIRGLIVDQSCGVSGKAQGLSVQTLDLSKRMRVEFNDAVRMDPNKARKNLDKRGVSFDEAASVFHDPLAATGVDPDHSEDKERLITFGMSSASRLLVIAHTERRNAIRIINARVVTQQERHIYEEG